MFIAYICGFRKGSQGIKKMDRNDTTNDSGQNLMHQTNDDICIGKNAKVTQHDPYFENAD